MPELLDGFDGSIKDENVERWSRGNRHCLLQPWEGDSHTYDHTRDTSIF